MKSATELKESPWKPIVTEDSRLTGFELHKDTRTGKYEIYDKAADLCYPETDSIDVRYRAFEGIFSTMTYFLPVEEKRDKYDYDRVPAVDKGVFKAGVVPLTW